MYDDSNCGVDKMNIEAFKGLDIETQIEYINSKMILGKSFSQVCKEIGYSDESTLRKKYNKYGYKLNGTKSAYTKVGDMGMTEVSKAKNTAPKEVIEKNTPINDNDMTKVITTPSSEGILLLDEDMKRNLINLAQNYDNIMNLINMSDKVYDKVYDGITIELPVETIKDFRTTIRINNVVWDSFKDFCAEHKEFTQKDLMSSALVYYVEKYKK